MTAIPYLREALRLMIEQTPDHCDNCPCDRGGDVWIRSWQDASAMRDHPLSAAPGFAGTSR